MRDEFRKDASVNRRTFLKGVGSIAAAPVLLPAILERSEAEVPHRSANAHAGSDSPDIPDYKYTEGPHISLSGTWGFQLDPKNEGIQQRWFDRDANTDQIFVPGSTDQAGYGEKTHGPAEGHLSRPYIYTGQAWYQCHVDIPEAWVGSRISLFLERCHWQTSAWLDGQPLGTRNSLSVPHIYELGIEVKPGPHRLTVCIDNTLKIDLGAAAHAITEQTQTNWNGMIGRIELRSTPAVSIERTRIFPEPARKRARIEILARNLTSHPTTGILSASVRGTEANSSVKVPPFMGESLLELEIALPEEVQLWDEQKPAIYLADIRLQSSSALGNFDHSISTPLSIREISTRGTQFTLNGRPVFLRGTVENAVFPLTAFPPMNPDPWRRIFRIAASYGMNHLRFHSWCPPEAAFVAADEAGFLLHIELPVFSHHVASTPDLPEFMRAEGHRILETYGNHPSFTMLCMGNELKDGFDFMDSLVNELKKSDGRHLYTYSTNNGRETPGDTSDYWVTEETKQGRLRIDKTRFGTKNAGTEYDFSKAIAGFRVPVVAHELGQWTVYPSYDEIDKYIGVLKPRNLEVFRAGLAKRGMGNQAAIFQQASGHFAAQVYKEDIESALRTPNLGGFQLLELTDYPGQQEALVGILDAFWDSKCLISPQEFRNFCGPSVPLCRFEKFVWTTGEIFEGSVELAHYGAKSIHQLPVSWSAKDDVGRTLRTGTLRPCTAAPGELVMLGKIRFPLASIRPATRITIEVAVGGISAKNSWRLWVYPATLPDIQPDGVLLTSKFDQAAEQHLSNGGSVVLCGAPNRTGPQLLKLRFLPVFWSFAMFKKQPGVLGVLCDPAHPALASFPTETHSDWQWWELTEGTNAFILDDSPAGLSPIIQVIDDFHRNHKLGLVFEALVGNGKLLATSLPLAEDLSGKPVSRQLLHSLRTYISGKTFSPQAKLSINEIRHIFSA
jgi:hypothetical protein